MYAVYKEKYDLALVVLGVFLTSLIYWHKSTNCWRKTLDVIYVKFSLFYHIIRAYNSVYYTFYYITIFISLCFYPLGIYLYNNKMYWESTYAHSMVHIIANLSNIILYTGYVVPLSEYFDYFNSIFNSQTNQTIQIIINDCIPSPLINLQNYSIYTFEDLKWDNIYILHICYLYN
jgi:hypothetical protein